MRMVFFCCTFNADSVGCAFIGGVVRCTFAWECRFVALICELLFPFAVFLFGCIMQQTGRKSSLSLALGEVCGIGSRVVYSIQKRNKLLKKGTSC